MSNDFDDELDEIRAALEARALDHGLRRVAGEVGMSATGVRGVILGTTPHPGTLRRLRRWMAEHGAGAREDAHEAGARPDFPWSLDEVRTALDEQVRLSSLRAVAADAGVSKETVRMIALGRTAPGARTLRRLHHWMAARLHHSETRTRGGPPDAR